MPPATRKIFFASLGCALVALFSGCAGYRLGPTNGLSAGAKSVEYVPFVNRTIEPRLSDPVTAALRKELQRDGTYRLATREHGDIVVTGAITDFERREQTLVSSDTIEVRDYQLTIKAHVTARERATNKVLLNQEVVGFALMRSGPDLPSAERQTVPLLASDLAKRVTALLADGKW